MGAVYRQQLLTIYRHINVLNTALIIHVFHLKTLLKYSFIVACCVSLLN